MMKIEVGIGVLSLPQVFDTLGMIPGVLALLAIASITTWSGYVVGCFKLNHPDVYGIADVGALMFGRAGQEIFSLAFCLRKNLDSDQFRKIYANAKGSLDIHCRVRHSRSLHWTECGFNARHLYRWFRSCGRGHRMDIGKCSNTWKNELGCVGWDGKCSCSR